MTAMSCTFTGFPRKITSGGSVRFFPVVSDNTLPIVTYAWTFGDTGTSSAAAPYHAYPTVGSLTKYTVTLTVTDANGNTANHTETDYVWVDAAANVPALLTDGTHIATSLFVTDDTNSMIVNRTQYGDEKETVTVDIDDPGSVVKLALDFEDAAFVDSSISNHTLTMTGGVARSSTQKHHGSYSALFDGVDDLVSCPDSDDFNLGSGDFGVSVWAYFTENHSGCFFSQEQTGPPVHSVAWYYRVDDSVGTFRLYVMTGGVTTFTLGPVNSASFIISKNEWHQFVVTRNGDVFSLYMDGTLIASGTDADAIPDVGADFVLGYTNVTTPDRWFKGYMDEFIFVKGFPMNSTGQVIISDHTSAHLYLLNPVFSNQLDSSPSSSVRLLDCGSATVTEKGLIVEGSKVLAIMGSEIIMSGVIRRVTQNTQSGYYATEKMKLWDVELDSDLMLLKKKEVQSSVLTDYGDQIHDTPGYIARRLLTPGAGEWDWRGNICCNDTKIVYQLNSMTAAEGTPSQYDHMISLQQNTNYDLVTRPDFEVWSYTDFDGVDTFTTGTHGYGTDDLAGYTLFVAARAGQIGVKSYGTITSNTTTAITATLTGVENVDLSAGTLVVYFGPKLDFAQDLGTPSSLTEYGANKDVLEYSDNDDKNKFCSKAVVRGKDLHGVTISVALSGVHAYEEDRQYFNDSTHITLKSEGYVYKNNWVANRIAATAVYVAKSNVTCNNIASSTHIVLETYADLAYFHNHMTINFTSGVGSKPANITSTTTLYYIINVNDNPSDPYLEVSATMGGSAIALDEGTDYYIHTRGGIQVDNDPQVIGTGDVVYISAATMPGGVSIGTGYYNGSDETHLVSNYVVGLFTSTTYTTTNQVSITSAGASVYLILSTDLRNTDEMGTTPVVWLYGWGYSIPNGANMALSTPFGSVTAATVNSATSESTDANGVKYTVVPLTAFPLGDYSGKGYLLNQRLYVDDYSQVGNNEVLIGEEKITIASSGNDTTYGNYIQFSDVTARVTSASLKCYPHGPGALVARTNYTEASPETGSAVEEHGIIIQSATVDTTITYGDLDMYATALLLGHGYFYRKASCYAPITTLGVPRVGYLNRTTPPRVGDTIDIVPFDGESAVQYQIVKVTFDIDNGKITLQLGDYEQNMFLSLIQKTAALNWNLT